MTISTELQAEALDRAEHGESLSNYPAIFEGFMERGIPEEEIEPRVNVLTYNAWRAKGRQVNKGEKGVAGVTWIVCSKPDAEGNKRMRPKTVYFFHVTQTKSNDPEEAEREEAADYMNPEPVKVEPLAAIELDPEPTPADDQAEPLALNLESLAAMPRVEVIHIGATELGVAPKTPQVDAIPGMTPLGIEPEPCPHTQRLIAVGMPCVACGELSE